MISSIKMFRPLLLAFGLALALSPLALGQDSTQNTNKSTADATRARSVSNGAKMKIKGVVVKRDADTFTVRDLNGADTVVRMTNTTSVKTNGGFLHGGESYPETSILRGLHLEGGRRRGWRCELVA